jgi:hypothetical protein
MTLAKTYEEYGLTNLFRAGQEYGKVCTHQYEFNQQLMGRGGGTQ